MLPVRRPVFLSVLTVVLGVSGCSSPREAQAPPKDAASLAAMNAAPAPAPAKRRGLPKFQAPATEVGTTVDDYHGTQVADPYRWLEEPEAAATAAFVEAQNTASRAFLDAIPQRASIRSRLEELWNFPRRDTPRRAGDVWFHARNDGLQNQAAWYVGSSPEADGDLLLDANTLGNDGTVALASFEPSPDGKRVAYATSTNGSDWREWRVLDVASKQPLADTLQWSKYGTVSWTADRAGFFYQRFPAPAPGAGATAPVLNAQLCHHRIGTPQTEDRVVYERPDEPHWLFLPEVTENGRFLLVRIGMGADRRNQFVYFDLTTREWSPQPLVTAFDATYDFLDHDGDTFFFRTDKDAPRGCVIALDRKDPSAAWHTIAPEDGDALRSARILGGHLVCHYLSDASSRIVIRKLDGTVHGTMTLPAIGSVGPFSGRASDPVAYCTFASFAHAPSILRHDFTTGKTEVFQPSQLAFDAARLVTERCFLQSRDGTRLCMFVVHRKGLRLDSSHPTWLVGYGGFATSMMPRFSVQNLVFVERGGVYAQAVLRGGGEYGEAWHRAGTLDHKQNVFDDFVACTDWLVRNGYCTRDRLAIGGGSNGGLLVGAVLTQHPELIGAAIPEAGVHDMLRYQKFGIGAAWAAEYGTSDGSEAFRWLRAYSPLHNVKPGTAYPPTLVMTGDHDDRVLPGHSYKFAAALQAAQGGDAPILLRVATAAGHGQGTPTSKLLDEAADRLAFLAAVLGGRS